MAKDGFLSKDTEAVKKLMKKANRFQIDKESLNAIIGYVAKIDNILQAFEKPKDERKKVVNDLLLESEKDKLREALTNYVGEDAGEEIMNYANSLKDIFVKYDMSPSEQKEMAELLLEVEELVKLEKASEKDSKE